MLDADPLWLNSFPRRFFLLPPELGIGDIGQAAAYAAYAADGVAAAVAVAAAAAADARRYTAVQLPWTKQAFFRRKL